VQFHSVIIELYDNISNTALATIRSNGGSHIHILIHTNYFNLIKIKEMLLYIFAFTIL